jgi:hypothetical protein
MRDFFKSELQTLKIKTGLNQYENLSALPDAEDQFKLLFDSLVMVCDGFPEIPDNHKKRIIQEQIYRDQDFNQLTPRVVWKWLDREKGKYFKELAHIPTESNAKPVTYDELSPEIKQGVDDLIKSLQMDNAGLKSVPQVSQAEIDAIKIEDLEHQEGIKALKYPSTSKEDFQLNQRKIEWAKHHTDLQTGKLKPGSPSFEEWLAENKYSINNF